MQADVIMKGLVEIIKQGGPLALWGVGIWLLVSLVKILSVLTVLYFVTALVCKTILDYKVASFKQVQLISSEVSAKLIGALNTFTDKGEQLFQKFEEQLNKLKEDSKKT